MKRLFLLLALVGMIATSCEESGIEEPSNPIEQPGGDDNTDQEQPGGDDNTDEEQPGDDGNKDDENNTEEEKPVFEIDGPGKYTIGAEGGSIDVVVTTNLEYRLEVSEDAQSWLTIADTRAVRTERLTISVSPNNTDSERTATISVFDVDNNKVFSFTLTQEYANPDEIIKFVDNTTKTICLINWDTNGDAELSIGEAVAVTDIGTKFQSKDIMAFDEFKYFTGVTTIVTGAFKDCANLVKISIPDSVTTIGDEAFCGCSSLTSITIPDSVTSIGDEAFEGCDSLTDGVSSDGLCIINSKGVLLYFLGKTLTEYIIPDGVTEIVEGVFSDCESLTSITIPDSVTTIGDSAFSGCTGELIINSKIVETDYDYNNSPSTHGWLKGSNFSSLTIGNGVTLIGSYAFYECDSLTSVTIGDGVTTIGESAFQDSDSLTSVTIGDGVTAIGRAAFWSCSSLTSVTIPDSVTEIGYEAFIYCESLTSITIPDSVTDIKPRTFLWCISLTSVTIPDSVTEIGYEAFYDCRSLTSVTIPDGVTSIGSYAFSCCRSLTEFNGKFASEDGRCLIIDGVLNSFAPAGITEYTIPDNVTRIEGMAFCGCSSLTSVTIPDSVTEIGYEAFYDCRSLTSVTIPDSVTTIGARAFSGCDSLTEFKGSGASSDGLCIINNKGVLLYLLGRALTEYIIPDGVTTIGGSAFCECDSLTSVTIGDGVTSIGQSAFSGCSSLTSVTIGDSVTTIGDCAFFGCDSLTSVTIGDGVTTIGQAAFYDCTSLTSVYCKALTPPTVVNYDFDWTAFDGNASGRMVYVPTESVQAYKAADGWKKYADAIVGYDFDNGVVVE